MASQLSTRAGAHSVQLRATPHYTLCHSCCTVNGQRLLERHQQVGYTHLEGGVKWDSANVIRLPVPAPKNWLGTKSSIADPITVPILIITVGAAVLLPVQIACVVAGVLAGMLGVGGGMVMQPLMLELGMLPDVSAATAAFMMLFTSSSTTLQFTLNGMLDWERNIALPVIGVVGAAVGSCVIGRLVEQYNRLSLIVFPVAVIMGISFFLMVRSQMRAHPPRVLIDTLLCVVLFISDHCVCLLWGECHPIHHSGVHNSRRPTAARRGQLSRTLQRCQRRLQRIYTKARAI